jgi:glycosyltransferase involved in cell wall biosynthesis
LPRARVLMLVENMSVPRDRRVWQEALALGHAGHQVVVVCPQGTTSDRDPFEWRDGVAIHRFQPAPAGNGAFGYLREYLVAVWRIWCLSRRLARAGPFDVVHAANPPDLLLLTARAFGHKATCFVFDHHDLVPELYRARFRRNRDLLYWATRALERVSFRLADVVIATNDSFRRIAIRRGGKRPDEVFVVRNGPDPIRFRPGPVEDELKRGRRHLIAYVGVMGPQDGVDYALRALAELARWRDDWHAVFVGDGDALYDLRRLATDLRITDVVEFTGFRSEPDVLRVLSTADVCIAPEPKTPLNDASTMIKLAEYMAMSRPIVCFDLVESRVTAGQAALYARANDERSFARCIDELLSDPARRDELGAIGRERVTRNLSWDHSERELLRAYDRALAHVGSPSARLGVSV